MLKKVLKWTTLFFLFFILSCNSSENILGVGSRLGLNCDFSDNAPPDDLQSLDQYVVAAVTRSPGYTWPASADFCGISHYEWSIGTTPEGEELVSWENIGNVTTYRDENLTLDSSATYYTSIRVVDEAGNISGAYTSDPWVRLDPVRDLPNLILRLDSEALTSLIDENGTNASSGGFTNSIDIWNDTSTTGASHNFFATSATARPTLNAGGYLDFDGNDGLTVNDHVELNIGTVSQRNFTAVFETGGDINTRQIIYDEGGNVRGMNLYIFNGQLYCGFYNTVEDGDGPQAFTFVSVPIATNSRYIATWIFDYTNYTGPTGPDGNLECVVNNVSIGTTTSTSLLYAHSGDIGLGAKVQDTYYETGSSGGNGQNFTGSIFEFMIVNGVPTADDIVIIYEYLSDKWNFP